MDYALVKTLHIISATILFGTGVGSTYYLWQANRQHDVRVIANVTRQVVIAVWIFTTPTVILQPLTGAWLVMTGGYALKGWLSTSIALYILVGACWLPVVWLQIHMRDTAQACAKNGAQLP